jgi:hypothetical protein
MSTTGRFLVTLWVIAIGSQLGCAALLLGGGAIAGAGMVAYAKGELTAVEDADLDRVWDAAQGAMDDLDFVIESRLTTAGSAKLVARGAGSRRVTVVVRRRVGNLTEISVRVGYLGDEPLSRLILQKILRRLDLATSS